jgi:hypothetical protein
MNRIVRLLTVTIVVLAACGGGDGDAGETTTAAAGGADSSTTITTTTAAVTTAAPVDAGGGASGDFCGFLGDYVEEADFSPVGLSPEAFEELFKDNLDAMQHARGLAPSQIEGDVAMFVDAFGGFIEFMEEFDFNFLAITEDALDDPRLLALEEPTLEAAGERIETFCGIEGQFIATPPSSGGGGDSGLPTATVPEGFPSELIPPGGEVIAAFEVSGSRSVGIEVASSMDDVIDYYTALLGAPTIEMSDPAGALWSTQSGGSAVNVVVAEASENLVNVNIVIE